MKSTTRETLMVGKQKGKTLNLVLERLGGMEQRRPKRNTRKANRTKRTERMTTQTLTSPPSHQGNELLFRLPNRGGVKGLRRLLLEGSSQLHGSPWSLGAQEASDLDPLTFEDALARLAQIDEQSAVVIMLGQIAGDFDAAGDTVVIAGHGLTATLARKPGQPDYIDLRAGDWKEV